MNIAIGLSVEHGSLRLVDAVRGKLEWNNMECNLHNGGNVASLLDYSAKNYLQIILLNAVEPVVSGRQMQRM